MINFKAHPLQSTVSSSAKFIHVMKPPLGGLIEINVQPKIQSTLAPNAAIGTPVVNVMHIEGNDELKEEDQPVEIDKLIPELFNTFTQLKIDEFLDGTPIFFKALLALKSCHGGYLTINDLQIVASAQVPLPVAQFVIMNADNLTDDGTISYGAAVWLIVDNRRVLGSQYAGIGHARKLCPTLVKCAKAHMRKAQHIGRWIIMNKSDPSGMMGRSCLHGDKITLEQDWLYLSSPSSDIVSLYRSRNTIADVAQQSSTINSKSKDVDYFDAPEDCVWRVELVAQKDMGTLDGRKMAKLSAKARSQLTSSVKTRRRLRCNLTGQISEKIDQKEKFKKIRDTLQTKLSIETEQDYFENNYANTSTTRSTDFQNTQSASGNKDSGGRFRVGRDEGKTSMESGSRSPLNRSRFIGSELKSSLRYRLRSPPNGKGTNKLHFALGKTTVGHTSKLEKIGDNYMKMAQKLLVSTSAWAVLHSAMTKYYDGPSRKLKINAAIVIQRFVRSKCRFLSITRARMNLIDSRTALDLTKKQMWKKAFTERLETKRQENKDRRAATMTTASQDGSSKDGLEDTFSFKLLHNTMSRNGSQADVKMEKEREIQREIQREYEREKENSAGLCGVTLAEYFESDMFKPDNPAADRASFNSLSPPLNRSTSVKISVLPAMSSTVYMSPARSTSITTSIPASRPQTAQHSYGESDDSNRSGKVTGVVAQRLNRTAAQKQRPMTANDKRKTATTFNFKNERNNLSFETNSLQSSESFNRISEGVEDVTAFRPKTALPRLEQSTVLKTPFTIGKGKSDNSQIAGKRNIYSLENTGNFEMLEKPKIDGGKQRREILRQRAIEEKELLRKMLIDRLGMSESNPSGLPPDVFENMHTKVSKKTGLNYLKTVSEKYNT
jgi:hypothetical protein